MALAVDASGKSSFVVRLIHNAVKEIVSVSGLVSQLHSQHMGNVFSHPSGVGGKGERMYSSGSPKIRGRRFVAERRVVVPLHCQYGGQRLVPSPLAWRWMGAGSLRSRISQQLEVMEIVSGTGSDPRPRRAPVAPARFYFTVDSRGGAWLPHSMLV